MILLIDNYDSFVHNLARYFERLEVPTKVVRNDKITVDEIVAINPSAIVISPGPCSPNEAGISLDVVRQLHTQFPILGICLGHQVIAAALGASVVRAPLPMHGRTCMIRHEDASVFDGLPNPLQVCRYHSLVVDPETLPSRLSIIAETEDDIVMAIAHREFPVVGLQFHPESILTESGYPLLMAFARLAGISVGNDSLSIKDELNVPPTDEYVAPDHPVTF